jgi:hypothetical protein
LIPHDASQSWRQRTAIAHAEARAVSRQLVFAELGRHGAGLPFGVAEALADRWAPMFDKASAGVIADHVARHLADAEVVRLCRDLGTASVSPSVLAGASRTAR